MILKHVHKDQPRYPVISQIEKDFKKSYAKQLGIGFKDIVKKLQEYGKNK